MTVQGDNEVAIELDSLGKILWSYPNGGDESKALGTVYHQNIDKSWHFTLYPKRNQVIIENATSNNRLTPTSFVITTSNAGSKSRIYHKKSDNTFWLINVDDFLVLDAKNTNSFDFKKHYPEIFNSQVYRIYFDNRDNIWLATAYGLYCIQFRKKFL